MNVHDVAQTCLSDTWSEVIKLAKEWHGIFHALLVGDYG